ncbi:hypothetical protein JG688_00005778, partial [Phytophthora aleatoria]
FEVGSSHVKRLGTPLFPSWVNLLETPPQIEPNYAGDDVVPSTKSKLLGFERCR